jgi:ATP-dependent HslUV protease ATP-binding subunit HslU
MHFPFKSLPCQRKGESNDMTNFSPREIVSELDRYIVGQNDAKRAVAIALRNRWRRQQLTGQMREEVSPKNILMIGPTGVGKTEIARRLAKLANAPFIKVEATKFTEVGYVGRDVDQMIRDLLEAGIGMVKSQRRKDVEAQAHVNAEARVLDALVGVNASESTRESFRKKLRSNELDTKEIEIQVSDSGMPSFDIPGMPGGSASVINITEMMGKAFGGRTKTRKISVAEAHEVLLAEESDKLLDQEKLVAEAIDAVENNGIVFLDEVDKICARSERSGADVSREGVQRDLLPLIEGTTVSTKHGPVKTDHILFIASGAFHIAKPSDLLPELQGRLPIRVELKALGQEEFRRILTEPEASLLKQYAALMATEGVTLDVTDDGVAAIARIAAEINASIENIGARRLQTVMERVLDDVSFTATDRNGETVRIDSAFVEKYLGDLAKNTDLSKFIL